MKSWLNTKRWYLVLVIFCMAAIVLGVIARFYQLGFPDRQVFDEVYFPVFARNYLEGVSFYDVHPPMGKFVIAMGIKLFGDTNLGWRIMPAVFGLGIIFLMGRLWWEMFKDKVGAWLIAAFFAIDGMFILYSRTGLMDGILFFFTFLCLWAALKMTTFWHLIFVATLIGVTLAIKWPAAAIILPIMVLAYRQKVLPGFLLSLIWAAAVYGVIVYIGQMLFHVENPWQETLNWNISALNYHYDLTDTHPWGSPWWSWPILMKPVLFWYEEVANSRIQLLTSLGNPLLWWGSTVTVLASSVYVVIQRIKFRESILEHPLTPFLVGFFAAWLPWALITRVLFMYHYFPAYGFALCVVVYWLSRLWKRQPAMVFGIFLAVLLVSLYFLPFAVGWWSLPQSGIDHRIWVNSWL